MMSIINNFDGGSGLIYCQKRETCENVVNALQRYHVNCKGMLCTFYHLIYIKFYLAYHAALSKIQRNEIQTAWQTNEIPLIVCTIAFGMGIDVSKLKSN